MFNFTFNQTISFYYFYFFSTILDKIKFKTDVNLCYLIRFHIDLDVFIKKYTIPIAHNDTCDTNY